MGYKILTVAPFDKQLKRLAKKYPSIKSDILQLANELITNPTKGKAIGKDCYKIRLAIKSKGKGKSGGARVITHFAVLGSSIYLLSIFDKSEKESITDKEIAEILDLIQ